MDIPEQPSTPETILCENCKTANVSTQKFCSSCSFPIGGSDEDKAKFKTKISGHAFLMNESAKETKSAQVIIYVLAAIMFLSGLYQWFGPENIAAAIANFCICLLYLILAAWCQQNPFGAILTALIAYITLIVVNFFFAPESLFSGLIMKLIFIGALVKGLRSAKDAQEHLAELKKLKVSGIDDE